MLPSEITSIAKLKNFINDQYFLAFDKDASITLEMGLHNDEKGELNVTFIVSSGQVRNSIEITLTGFLTTSGVPILDEIETTFNYIRSLSNQTIKTGADKLLPNQIRDETILKANVHYPDPAKFSASGLTLTPLLPFETNNSAGTLTVTYQIVKATLSKSEKITYLGFLTTSGQNDKNIVASNARYLTNLNQTVINKAVFPSEITNELNFRKIISPYPEPTDGAIITTKYNHNNLKGELEVIYTISKGEISKSVTRYYSGFETTSAQVVSSMIVETNFKDYGAKWSQEINPGHYLIGTENGVYQVENDPTTGKILSSIPARGKTSIPLAANGWIQQVEETYYLIGTDRNGIYEIAVDPVTGLITTAHPASVNTPMNDKIPANLASGFSIQVDRKNYLIGTPNDGLYWLKSDLRTSGVVAFHKVVVEGANRNSFKNGWIEKFDNNHYWIGGTEGIYQLAIKEILDTEMRVESTLYSAVFRTPDQYGGWVQRVSNTHYLIASYQNGLRQVEIGSDSQKGDYQLIKEGSEFFVPLIGVDTITSGWVQQIDFNNYLISVNTDGVYQLVIYPEIGFVARTIPLSTEGTISIPKTVNQFVQKIENTNKYWMGSNLGEIYQIQVDFL